MKTYTIPLMVLFLTSCGNSEPGQNSRMQGGMDQESGNRSGSAGDGMVVETLQVEPERFSRFIEVTGHLEALQDAFISPEISGQVERIPVDRGARTDRGDLLVKLKTDVIEKNIDQVKINLELAERLYDKQRDLWEQNIGSELQYLEARNRKESLEAQLASLEMQLDKAHIRAPFPGIVDAISIKEGEIAAPGARLMHLVNLERMRVTSQISEAFLNSVEEGDTVEMRFASYPGLLIHQEITRLGEVIDPQTRTFTLEVVLENRNEKLKPNMLTTVRIEEFTSRNALVVPSIILKNDFEGTFLFRVLESENRLTAEKVYVEPGPTVQDKTMILEGISAGDRVITRGYNLVSEGSRIRLAQTEG